MQQRTNISSTFSKYCTGYCGFAFNGKEKDNEVKGVGNSLDFGARIYDPLTGRWLSLDPLMKKYPFESNYVFTSNNPIFYAEKDGRDKIYYLEIIRKDGTKVQVGTYREVNKTIKLHVETGTGSDGLGGETNAYFTDIKQTVTLDIRTNKFNISSETSDLSSRYSLTDGLEKFTIGTTVGQQPGGFMLTSKNGLSGGPMNEATKGSSEILNWDDIGTIIGALAKSPSIPDVKSALGYAKFVSMMQKMRKTGKDIIKDIEKQYNNDETTVPVYSGQEKRNDSIDHPVTNENGDTVGAYRQKRGDEPLDGREINKSEIK